MNGAEYLCKILERYGVRHIFGLFGDIQTDFAHAVRKSRIEWIGVHNEKSGGFMADIYGRVKGAPGIIFSTLGPGGTNLTSALANATQDRSPLIAISDQVSQNDFRTEAHQYVDFVQAFHPKTGITKQTFLVSSADHLSGVFDQAFAKAMEEPKGAVHISIPMDILGSPVNGVGKVLKSSTAKRVLPKSTVSKDALKKILASGKPGLVIVGGSVERSGAQRDFLRFIEHFQLPVLTTFRGKNALPSDHPQCLGTVSRHLGDVVKDVLGQASYLMLVGYDYNEGVKPSMWAGQARVVNVDTYDNRIEKIFTPPSLFGDLGSALCDLIKMPKPTYATPFPFASVKARVKKTVAEALDVARAGLHPGRIIDAVNALYRDDSVIVCDVGLNKYYAGLLLKSSESNKIIFSNGQSSMAFSSGVMGAKLADPKKSVIALVGDGGFLMDPQEILTAVAYKQPIVWVIFNNGGLGLTEQAQKEKSPNTTHGVKFGKVFFAKLAESCGLYGIRVEPGMSLLPILAAVKNMKRPALIDVPVVYTPRRKSYRE